MCPDSKRICCRRNTPILIPEVHLMHMCANSSMWGWWTLFAALNPVSIHPLDVPLTECEGVAYQWGRVSSEARGTAGRSNSQCLLRNVYCGARVFRSCGLLRGQMADRGGWGMASFLVGRWGWGDRGVWHCLLQKPIKDLPPLSQPPCHLHFLQAFCVYLMCCHL